MSGDEEEEEIDAILWEAAGLELDFEAWEKTPITIAYAHVPAATTYRVYRSESSQPPDQGDDMNPQRLDNMFHGLSYKKTSTEIVEAAKKKVPLIQAKIEERIKRIADLRATYEIDDKALAELFSQARDVAKMQLANMSYSYTSSASNAPGGAKIEETKQVGAGVVSNLLSETDFINAEKAQIVTLERIVRNLRPLPAYNERMGVVYNDDSFALTDDELKYLGF